MKKIIVFLVLTFAAVPVAGAGWDCGTLSGGYGGLDVLYWMPSMCPVPFAEGATTSQVGNIQVDNQTDFMIKGTDDWGVRAFIGYNCECLFGDLSYHWYESTQNLNVDRGVFNTLEMIGITSNHDQVRSRMKHTYNNLELRLGSLVYADACRFFSLYTDFQYAQIEMDNFTEGRLVGELTFRDLYRQGSKFQGGGIGLGVSGRCDVLYGFGITGRLTGLAMIGETSLGPLSKNSVNGDEQNNLAKVRTSRVLPAADIRISLIYAYECGCVVVQGQLGYELDYYWSALRYSFSDETDDGIPNYTCQDIGYGGLFFGVTVAF